MRIQHHPQTRGDSNALAQTHVHTRVVGQHGAGTGQHRTGARAPALHIGACVRAGDPLRGTIGQRGAPVQAGRQLDPHERPALLDPGEKPDVQLTRGRRHQADIDHDPGLAQQRKATTGDLVERIADRTHHPRHPGLDQGQRARRRAPVMGAGFQGDVGGRAAGTLTGHAQRMHLGMWAAGTDMEALADHGRAMGNHTAHHRIGPGAEAGPLGQLQRTRHMRMVNGRKYRAHFFSPASAASPSRVAMALRKSATSWKER